MSVGSSDRQAILDYHEATRHSEQSIRASRHFLDWENKPLPFKVYRDLPPIPLAREIAEKDEPALEAIARSPQQGDGEERIPDTAALARVLYLAAGITKVRRGAGGSVYFRAYPNTGALHHVDLYLATGELPGASGAGLPAGVYHFAPHDFALRRLREGDCRRLLVEASGGSPDLERAPVVVATASTYWRNAWKYQERAWRHAFWDAGTLHANLLAAAETEELGPRIVLGWADAPVQELFGLDPATEGALTLVSLGRGDPSPAAPDLKPLRLETEPLSPERVDYPAIRAAQAASSLADAAQAAAWRGAAPAADDAPPAPLGALTLLRPAPEAGLPRVSLDRVIRRRGSTRAFDATRSITFEELSTALDRATRGVPGDWLQPPGATLLDLYLVVNAVEGLAPGAYHYRRGERALELLAEGDFRRAAGRLALGQQLAADAAVCCYSLVSLGPVLERHGARGYRAAQLEGGITGGRLYLAAYAQGFGATGLTFFDDEVVEFFSPHATGKSVMFLVALGRADRAALGLAARA